VAEAATVVTPDEDATEATPLGDVTVLARGLHVYYRVYEDRRPRIGEIFARRFRRPGYREVKAVNGVDLTARQGESIGLIGRNGSGKSTLLQAIAGLLPASHGEVYARSQPSLLGVSAALQKSVSGRRNIILGGLALGMTREEVDERIDDIIEWTGLGDFIDLPIRTYSSGMRARLHFAISTAVEPEILLIDEALSVGDEVFKERSKERIGELLEDAGTVFVCSHSMGTIKELCDRVIWLEEGRIEMDGDADEVVSAYKKRYQLGSKNKKNKKSKKKATSKKPKPQPEPGQQQDTSARES
jgi:teichoic acid transport system ATP-binding protein